MATAKKKITYKAFTPAQQYQAAFDALAAAEAAHYRLAITTPGIDPSLDDRLEAAAAEVERLQEFVDEAEKARTS